MQCQQRNVKEISNKTVQEVEIATVSAEMLAAFASECYFSTTLCGYPACSKILYVFQIYHITWRKQAFGVFIHF